MISPNDTFGSADANNRQTEKIIFSPEIFTDSLEE